MFEQPLRRDSLLSEDRIISGLFVRRTRLHGRTTRPAVLFVHGGSHGYWAFSTWLDIFARGGYDAYSMSLRNHEGSYRVNERDYLAMRINAYCEDVETVVSYIGSPVILVGHSMGGIVCQMVAENGHARALVLVASVGPCQLGNMRRRLRQDKVVLPGREAASQSFFYALSPDKQREYARRLVPESPGVMNHYGYEGVCIDRRRITCPLFVMTAECDRTSVPSAEALAGFYNAPFYCVPETGHDIMLEPAADKAADVILDWLASVGFSKAVR
ncbi:alpha/beta hydrolase [Desulfovibrio inopinatus]|uniref:alpha/beta hydrolase n=1 Tax=Desulfovibrio inopinatus TaxID=102109 RepID=UPI0004022E36|nr:alpha/beta hydrolase [Desulfovibrio inopinatus]